MAITAETELLLRMATTKQLSELFRAVAGHDLPRAVETARRIAQAEAERGNHSASRDLLGSLNGYASPGHIGHSHSVAQSVTVQQCVTFLEKPASLDSLDLPAALRSEITAIALEWRHRGKLSEQGITRRCRLLFHGPPGCGKSATASALGRLVELPVYLVRFDALIGSYLGQTALRLREVFRFANENPCVLLFDEVDALAKRRGTPMEVGEIDRVVIAFMQELEHASSTGFIVATSNLARSLDDALWRRFDLTVEFPRPTRTQLVAFTKRRCKELGFAASKKLTSLLAKAGSFGRAEQLITDEGRRRALAKLK